MSEVFKAIELPDQEFSSKEEMFAALKENQEEITDIKLARLKHSDSIKGVPMSKFSDQIKGIDVPDDSIIAVINTTKYMDSHSDVHLNGIWNQSVKQQQGKILFVADHDLSIKSVIAYPKDVVMSIKEIAWKDLGASFEGKTQALLFTIKKENIRLKEAKEIIEEKIDIEHSVRMQYVKIALAIDSDSDDFAEQKAVWDNTVGIIANKERAVEQGYFWAVGEAKIFKEGSMVLAGSNDVTPMLLPKQEFEPPAGTQDEPLKDTQTKSDGKDSFDVTSYFY